MGEMKFQVHHIIPVSLFNIYGEQLREILGAAKTEHVIQSYNNRIVLFMEDGPANALKNLGVDGLRDVPLGATRHNDGRHKNYTEAVGEVIREIISSNLESRRTMLIDMQFSIREMLQSGDTPLSASVEDIQNKIREGMATIDTGNGIDHEKASAREAHYDTNNKKYPKLMNDPVRTDEEGKFTSDKSPNDNFVEKTGHEIAKALLDADKKEAGKNKAAGKEEKGFLNDKSRTALEEVVSGDRKDNNKIRDAIAQGVHNYKKNFPGNSSESANPGDKGAKQGNNHTSQGAEGAKQGNNHANQGDERVKPGSNHANQGSPHANEGGAHTNQGGTHANESGAHANQSGTHANEGGAHANQGGTHANEGSAHANQGSAHANQGSAHANQGSAHANQGSAHANESGARANQGGSHANQGSTNNNQGSAGSKNRGRGVSLSSTGIKRQGGFVDFGDIAHAAGRTAHDLARDLGHSLTRSNLLAQNVMIPDGKGGIRFNPDLAEGRVGNFIKDKFWAGKVGALGGIAAFLDNTFNGLVKGIETGDWRDFQDQAFQYGEEAVKSTIGFVAATELVSFTTALMGAPYVLVGELALAGLMLYGAFQIGWSIGSLLRKGWNWLTGNHEDWDNLPREDGYIVYDPLTLDLDGDGIEAIASNGHKGALFDHDKDGIRTATGWISKDDGLLIYDRNGDGVVNDGSELFGDNTLLKNGERAANGYQALAELDDNGDGKVDTADSAFAHLRVWRDLNQDGISQEGELLTLEEAKVKALNLANQNRDRDLGNGNTLAEEGTYTDSDGNEKQMGDLNLAADHFHSRYADSLPLTDEQQQAPNLRGSGRVRDLREAAAESPDVAAALQAYANAQTKEEQLALRDQLLRAWAGTDKRFTTEGVLKAASKNVVMASKGKNSVRLTPSQAAALGTIEGPSIWSLLGIEDPEQKKKAALLEKVGILDAFTGTDSSHLYYGTKLQAQHIIDTIEKTYANLADNLYDGLLFQTRLKPYLNAIRFGMSEDGKLQLDYSGVAALFDEVHAKNPGKAFTDLGELLAKGNADGKNTAMAPLAEQFVQYVQDASNNGTLETYSKVLGGNALTAIGYRLDKTYGDLLGEKNLVTMGYSFGKEGNDTLRGNNSANYLNGNKGDDTLWGNGGNDALYGAEGNDVLSGGDDNDFLNGGTGDDYLRGDAGNDILQGGEGDDKLYGGEGKDILDGGSGNDYLDGGNYGSDIYTFREGHGQDVVDERAYNDASADTLHFKGGIAEKSRFSREGLDLVIRAYGNNDRVTLKNYFNGDAYRYIYFQFDDKILERADIAKQTFDFNGTNDRDAIHGWITDDIIHGMDGNDNIYGNDGNDTLNGNEGDDILGGGNGNDHLNGGAGNDYLRGETGDDILDGGEGDDKLYGEKGKDILDGGTGNDRLEGGDYGSDIYLFRAGHGHDVIAERAAVDEEADILRFEDANSENSYFSREGLDLVIKAYGKSDSVSLKDYFNGDNYRRFYFQFDDKTLETADIIQKTLDVKGTDSRDLINGWITDDIIYGLDGDDNLSGNVGEDTIYGGNGNDALFGGEGDDVLSGDDGNDILYGGNGNDRLDGGAGNDYLRGDAGHDILRGGEGNDNLAGGEYGSDTYIFHSGHGQDVIAERASKNEDADTLRFEGVKAEDGRFIRDGLDLVIKAYGDNDSVALKDYFNGDNYRYFHFKFDDKTLETTDIGKKTLDVKGTNGRDLINGWITDDIIHGLDDHDTLSGNDGNDMLYGDEGNDSLQGGDGNDKLYGEKGEDILDGGTGNDHLEGGDYGKDTYLFRAGHGHDVVSDRASKDEDADTLRFEGTRSEDTHFFREGQDLVISAYDNDDRVTLKDYFNNYFNSDDYRRFYFQFDDKTLDKTDMLAKTFDFKGTENRDTINGWKTDDNTHGLGGDDTLSGNDGNDILYGDEGNDAIYGGNGDDHLYGGLGDDYLRGDNGNDVLQGGDGNDKLYGEKGEDILDGGTGNDYLEGGDYGKDTYLFRAGHGYDIVSDRAYKNEDADTLRFEGAKVENSKFRREGYNLIINAYGKEDEVSLKNYFSNEDNRRYDFQFDDATFKAAELRGKDLPTEGLKAPVAATAQTTDAAIPDSATAAVTPQENAATATADESKAQAAKASEKIIEVDTFHPPLRLHKDDTASTGAAQKADNATVSGNNAGKNVLAAQTPANMANPSAATNAASAATAPASDKPQTAAVASADSSAASKADTQSATVQQNAESVNAALKTGGAAATPASTLDAKAAQQSQQMLSAMATQSQTATPTALAAPDLQPKPQLVASQV